MIFDPAQFSSFILLLTAWGGAFIVALWLSLIFWTYRDMQTRSRDRLLRFLAVLVVGILFLPGIVIYLVLRPQRTIEEEYQHTLEEEALLNSIEHDHHCPTCGIHTQDEWQLCPNCHTKLKKTCHTCSYLMEMPWNICPRCGTPAPGMRKENLTMDDAMRPVPNNSPQANE